jgi:hypothetical protein
MIQKGKISGLEGAPDAHGNAARARVVPDVDGDIVTLGLVIPARLRGGGGRLAPGVEVVFAVFEDLSGYIIDRADGEFFGELYGDITINGGVAVRGGDISTDAVGSYNGHTHSYYWTYDGGNDVTGGPE